MTGLVDFDKAEAAADVVISTIKRGHLTSLDVYKGLQLWADHLGKEGESSAQKFDRAFARGSASRVPRASEIMGALRELSALEKLGRTPPSNFRFSQASTLPPRISNDPTRFDRGVDHGKLFEAAV